MNSIGLIKPFFRENRYKIAIGLASLMVVDLLQLYIPRIIKRAVDDLTALQVDMKGLLIYAACMAGIALVIGLFRYVWRRCLLGTSRRIEEGLRNRLFDHVQSLSASYFDHVKTGDLMAHSTNDIQQIRMAAGMGMVALNDAVVLGTAAIGFMLYINVFLTFLVVIPMPFIVLGTRFFSKKMHHRYQAVQAAFSDLTEVIRERFAGIRIIKAHNLEKDAAARVRSVSQAYIDKNMGLVKIIGSFFPMMLLFSNLSLVLLLYFGGRQTILQTITPGDFVAFISYLGLLTWPMMALGWVINLIQRGRASLDRIHRILKTPPDIADNARAVPSGPIKGRVVFKNISFAYPSDTETASAKSLDRIDLTIEPGRVLGIVGPPGSGKTTLLNLVPRLYDPTSGNVFIDGRGLRTLPVQELRSHIAMMPQEPFLFSGTIAENIRFGAPDATFRQLEQAAADAALLDTVTALPDGFDTVVGEKGIILSGGQKQRVALARCLLSPSTILLLDDPVSQVDLETGSHIIAIIRKIARRRSVIIASHRLSAVQFADQIITLDQGRIIERGTHTQLLKTGQYYAKTFHLQETEEDLHAQ